MTSDPTSWPRSGWCFKCGPTRRPIAPDEVSELECCFEHLLPEQRAAVVGRPAEQLVLLPPDGGSG